MARLKTHVQDRMGFTRPSGSGRTPGRERRSRTAGKDRDFDRSGAAANQGHGHPREEHSPQVRPRQRRAQERKQPRGIRGGHSGQGRRHPVTRGGNKS